MSALPPPTALSRLLAGLAEVGELGVASAVDHHVARLEVAVDHAAGVGVGQSLTDLAGQAQRLVDYSAAQVSFLSAFGVQPPALFL